MNMRFKSTLRMFQTISKCPPAKLDTGCTFCLTSSVLQTLPEVKTPPYNVSKTAPPMDKLIIYLSGNSKAERWPKKLEDVPGSVMQQLGDVKRGSGVGVVYSSLPASQDQDSEFIVYPKGLKVRIPKGKESIEEFFTNVYADELVGETVEEPVVLICSHEQRDMRCGVIGPMVYNEFQKVGNTKVGLCSHVGGHLYAGNVLVCRPERIDWYGMVRPENVQGLYDVSIVNGDVIGELYRGSTCLL